MVGVRPVGVAAAEPQARYVTWRGFDDPRLFAGYRDKHGGLPEITVFDNQNDVFTSLSEGLAADVVHPCYEVLPRWREANLIQSIDTARLRFWGGILPELRALPGVELLGRTWFVPVDWGQTSIAYRSDLVELPEGEESWSLLWDERYRGRVAVIALAEDAWWSAAIYAGVAGAPLDEAAFREVRGLLDRQRGLVRFYARDMAEVERALAAGELVAAMTWSDSVRRLRRRGLPVRFADPKEGALTWCCGLVRRSGSLEHDKAHDLIDALISPEAGAAIIETFGFGHANRLSFERVGEVQLEEAGLPRSPRALMQRAVFPSWQPPEVRRRIQSDWAAVLAGP